jgi:hypothetical protein
LPLLHGLLPLASAQTSVVTEPALSADDWL